MKKVWRVCARATRIGRSGRRLGVAAARVGILADCNVWRVLGRVSGTDVGVVSRLEGRNIVVEWGEVWLVSVKLRENKARGSGRIYVAEAETA